MDRCRERRVNEHDTRHDAGIEVVVDVCGVELRRGNDGKELRKNAGAALGELVEDKGGAGQFSEDGKKACASRRFQHDVRRRNRSRLAGDKSQPDRRRKLLEGFTLLGSPCVSRKEGRNTTFLLLAKYGGAAIIPLEIVCRDYFSHLTPVEFARKATKGEIDLPLVRIENSQKAAKGIYLTDLAKWIDARRAAAQKELDQLHGRR
jgi:hypothetical protein